MVSTEPSMSSHKSTSTSRAREEQSTRFLAFEQAMEKQSTRFICITYQGTWGTQNGSVLGTNE